MSDLESVRTVEDAARLLDAEEFGLSIDSLDDVWAVCDDGRPQFWRDTRAEAEEVLRDLGSRKWSVEHFTRVWRVCMGDQYIFTTPDQAEAEGFVFGMAAHMVFRRQRGPS